MATPAKCACSCRDLASLARPIPARRLERRSLSHRLRATLHGLGKNAPGSVRWKPARSRTESQAAGSCGIARGCATAAVSSRCRPSPGIRGRGWLVSLDRDQVDLSPSIDALVDTNADSRVTIVSTKARDVIPDAREDTEWVTDAVRGATHATRCATIAASRVTNVAPRAWEDDRGAQGDFCCLMDVDRGAKESDRAPLVVVSCPRDRV
jgi:hypothetical protein